MIGPIRDDGYVFKTKNLFLAALVPCCFNPRVKLKPCDLSAMHASAILVLVYGILANAPDPMTCASSTCGSVTLYPGIQVHDAHPAHDMANIKTGSWWTCQTACCQTTGCKAFYHTTNQSSSDGNCTVGQPCCWLKPTFNSSRTDDVCQSGDFCVSGVLHGT